MAADEPNVLETVPETDEEHQQETVDDLIQLDNTDDELERYIDDIADEILAESPDEGANAPEDDYAISAAMRTQEVLSFGAASVSAETRAYSNIPYDANASRK